MLVKMVQFVLTAVSKDMLLAAGNYENVCKITMQCENENVDYRYTAPLIPLSGRRRP